ncbi:hypothetical protein ACHAQH_007811 [Verticillium albo-atrum]
MAETLGLVVAAPAIITMGTQAVKLVSALRSFSKDRDNVRKDFELHIAQIKTFGDVTKLSFDELESLYERRPNLSVFQYVHSKGTFESVKLEATLIEERLIQAEGELRRLRGRSERLGPRVAGPFSLFLWRAKKDSILEAFPHMQHIVANLNLIVGTANLAITREHLDRLPPESHKIAKYERKL